MNSTGKSFFNASVCESPSRVASNKKVMSSAVPGGLALNAIHNDPVQNAFNRENNRVTGFGAGMASALIGNASRRGNSLLISDVKDTRTALGTIGWGVTKSNLD